MTGVRRPGAGVGCPPGPLPPPVSKRPNSCPIASGDGTFIIRGGSQGGSAFGATNEGGVPLGGRRGRPVRADGVDQLHRYTTIRRVPTGIRGVWDGPTRGTSPREGTF